MRYLRYVLLALAIPVGVLGYNLGVAIIAALPIPVGAQGLLQLVVPLLVAGLCIMPFIIPTFDYMAKRDLAARPRTDDADDPGKESRP